MTGDEILDRIHGYLTDLADTRPDGTLVTRAFVEGQERIVVTQPGGPHLAITVSTVKFEVSGS